MRYKFHYSRQLLLVNLAMNFSTTTDQLESADVGNGDNQARPSQEKSSEKRRPRKNLFCPHCDEMVSKTTFYRHKKCYYDSRAKRWTKTTVNRVLEVISSDEDGSGQADAPPISIEGDCHTPLNIIQMTCHVVNINTSRCSTCR